MQQWNQMLLNSSSVAHSISKASGFLEEYRGRISAQLTAHLVAMQFGPGTKTDQCLILNASESGWGQN